MKKALYPLVAAILAAGCATAQDAKPAAADAKAGCTPPPTTLVVKDLKKGTGEAVQLRNAIAVGYTGWLYDPCTPDHKGKKFDSSENRPAPFGFMVGAGRVIKGWDEGVVGMQKGGKRELVIPPDKAYGPGGRGPIPPHSTLLFEVELIDILSGGQPQVHPAPQK